MVIFKDKVKQIKEQSKSNVVEIKQGKNTIALKNIKISTKNIALLTEWRKKICIPLDQNLNQIKKEQKNG